MDLGALTASDSVSIAGNETRGARGLRLLQDPILLYLEAVALPFFLLLSFHSDLCL